MPARRLPHGRTITTPSDHTPRSATQPKLRVRLGSDWPHCRQLQPSPMMATTHAGLWSPLDERLRSLHHPGYAFSWRRAPTPATYENLRISERMTLPATQKTTSLLADYLSRFETDDEDLTG